jgi:amino acid adenylation domain-containing protein
VRELAVATRKEEAMWLLERLVPDAAPNNLSLAFQADGRLSLEALNGALALLLHRHEVLRTVYFAAGADLMKSVLAPAGFDLPLRQLPLPDMGPFPADPDELEQALLPFINQRFVFDGRPLVRAALYRHPAGDVFCLALHHLVYDVISATVMLDELTTAYNKIAAGEPVPAQLRGQIAPFTEPEPKAGSLAFWREQLASFEPADLDLWCGRPDTAAPTMRGGKVTMTLSPQTTATVQRLRKQLRAPEAVVLLAAFYQLLAAHGAGPGITVGSPVSVRPMDNPRLVGHHTNVLPLFVEIDPRESFESLVRRTRDTYFAALSHVDVPVDSIPDLVPRAGASWQNRLCRHLFNYFPQLGLPDFYLSGVRARPLLVDNGFSKFDLEFFVASSTETIVIIARYCEDKLSRADAAALLARYEAMLSHFGERTDEPLGELAAWSEQDRAVIGAANHTTAEVSPLNVAERVHQHVRRAPGAIAVQHGDRAVSYRQLWEAATATRAALAGSGVRPGDIVAIAAARGPELIAAVLGIWLAGAAYLPVDPEHPAQRVSYILTDSAAKILLTDRDLMLPPGQDIVTLGLSPVPATAPGEPAGDFPVRIGPGDCAYLIYTSGSSGRPKGALLPHRAIANIAADYVGRLRATADDVTLWLTTFAFDMANLEVYVPLYSGGRIVVAPDEARVSGSVLRDLIDRYQPGIIQATPTTWRMVLDEVSGQLAGRRVVTGAEPVPVTVARDLLATGCELHHAYGPTETTTWCTWSAVTSAAGSRLDIGKPISNTQVMILSPDGRELPVGVSGEVCIAGHGVALGYHRRPGLTAERFAEHPVHGRYYRSGDTGRWRADGALELFGRSDRQVKVRGNRIELGEVEAALLGHPGVRACAVIVAGDGGPDSELVAFVVPAADGSVSDDLWEYARAGLPRAAVPQRFIQLDALPVNNNEKVDYLALGQLAGAGHGGGTAASPDTPLAGEVVQDLVILWQQLLGSDEVTPRTNFFTSGGHSLLGAQLLQQVEEKMGVTVKLAELFAAPTPAALAEIIEAGASH